MLALLHSPFARHLSAGLGLLLCLSTASGKDSVYSKSTVVIYNKNFPGSDVIASHYVTQRSIPSANRIGLDCSSNETITRAEYRDTIERPLRELFSQNEWWTVEGTGQQQKVTSNKMHVIALIHGMPLKIRDTTDDPRPTIPDKLATDAASVDSELTMLGDFNDRLRGYLPNPYFRQEVAFGDAEHPNLMLVGRLDGPDVASCRRLIDDASEVERTGLWGMAYVDLAQKTNGGYELGENWLKGIIAQCEDDGIACIVDSNSSNFPNYYPMDDAALYFGWYTRNANGPFANPNFQLKKGAIACHIHSFSALTVRSKTEEWVGPLVNHGAAGVLGNVWEPLLDGTAYLDLFVRRLLDGYTLAEAAAMSTSHLSWMSVVVGDPLYRPYDGFRTYEPQFFRADDELEYKTYHVATKMWGDKAHEYKSKLEAAEKNHKSGFYAEAMAARQRNAGNKNGAISLLEHAKERYLSEADQFRVELQIVDLERQRNNKTRARDMLIAMKSTYQADAAQKVISGLLNQIDPPGPAGS